MDELPTTEELIQMGVDEYNGITVRDERIAEIEGQIELLEQEKCKLVQERNPFGVSEWALIIGDEITRRIKETKCLK